MGYVSLPEGTNNSIKVPPYLTRDDWEVLEKGTVFTIPRRIDSRLKGGLLGGSSHLVSGY